MRMEDYKINGRSVEVGRQENWTNLFYMTLQESHKPNKTTLILKKRSNRTATKGKGKESCSVLPSKNRSKSPVSCHVVSAKTIDSTSI